MFLLKGTVPAKKSDDSVAQPVEHYTFNVGVLGSNPSGITKQSESEERERFGTALFFFWPYRIQNTFRI
jgi:hypothetical protein